jgi:hypothetical protein
MKMESTPTLRLDPDAAPQDSSPMETSEARRPGMMDPEAWHDLAERGTPRNG